MAAKAIDFARAKTSLATLKAQKQDVDWSFYRNTLKNQAVVDKLEKIWKDFKPQDYDVGAQLKAIDQFEGKAVTSAEEASKKIRDELSALDETLKNIEGARPVNQLTLADIEKAEPRIAQTVETMVRKGKFGVEGYNEKFGNLSLM